MNLPELDHQVDNANGTNVVVHVPRVIKIIGGFSYLINGWSLLCTIEDNLVISLSKRDDNVIKIINSDKQDKKKFVLSSIKFRKEDKWANAIKAVFSTLTKNGYKLTGVEISISGRDLSTTPFSLTSSLFVGIISGINKLFNLNFDKEKIFTLSLSSNSFSPYYQALYDDVWALMYAEDGFVYLIDEKNHTIEKTKYNIQNKNTLILDSGLPFSVLSPILDEFKEEVTINVKKIETSLSRDKEIRGLNEKELRSNSPFLLDRERRAIFHLIQASENAKKAFCAIENGDGISLGKILDATERSIYLNAELSSPELDWIFRRCQESNNAGGICSLGSDNACSFLCLVDEEDSFPNNQKVEEYERIFGFHPEKRSFYPYHSTSLFCR